MQGPPQLSQFDAVLTKGGVEDSIGVNIRGAQLCTSGRPVVRVISYKTVTVDGNPVPGPAERTGVLRDGDILVGIDGASVLYRDFGEVVRSIKSSGSAPLRVRVLRPMPFAKLQVRSATRGGTTCVGCCVGLV